MKTRLIRIDRVREDGSYYIGLGFGFEKDSVIYAWFVGIIIQFLYWTIRVGIDREIK